MALTRQSLVAAQVTLIVGWLSKGSEILMEMDRRTHILVALMGLIGVLAAALIANWGKFTGNPNVNQPTKVENAIIDGNNNTVVQGSNNTVIAGGGDQFPKTLSFSSSQLRLKNTKHIVRYFSVSGSVPSFSIDRVNKKIKEYAEKIYNENKFYEEVDIDIEPRFYEFGLLGVSSRTVVFGVGKEIPFDKSIGEANATFLLWMVTAHELQKSGGIVISIESGEPFELKDLFRYGYEETVNALVINQLKTEDLYFPCEQIDAERKELGLNDILDPKVLGKYLGYEPRNCFSTVLDNSRFYLTPTEVVLKYSRYEIAPGAAGDIEVKIPIGELTPVANPNGPLRHIL